MIVYNAKVGESEFSVIDSREGEHMLEHPNGTVKWIKEEDIDELEIDCSGCGEERWVETGTWALDKEMCAPCYCAYQGG